MTATILLNSQVVYPPFFPFPYHSSVLHRMPFTVCTFLRQFIMCFLQCDHTYLFLSQSVPFPTTHFAIPYWSPPLFRYLGPLLPSLSQAPHRTIRRTRAVILKSPCCRLSTVIAHCYYRQLYGSRGKWQPL